MLRGGVCMTDKENDIICKYGLKIASSGRCKGATLIFTGKEYYLLKEYCGTVKHLEFEENLLNRIAEIGGINVDNIIRDVEGNLINEDDSGKKYILRKWYDAKDCDSKNESQIIMAVQELARLHDIMNKISYGNIYLNEYFDLNTVGESINSEFEKHNKELKRTRNFIRKKRNKNEFELLVLREYDRYYADGMKVYEIASDTEITNFIKSAVESGRLVHGAYNYHNVMFKGNSCIITNFEKTKCSVQIRDLYDFARKVLEKHGWNSSLGNRMIEEYNKIRPISDKEIRYLMLKFMYPEKYWKILNHYNNNNKAWLPDKDILKLKYVTEQYNQRINFVKTILNFN